MNAVKNTSKAGRKILSISINESMIGALWFQMYHYKRILIVLSFIFMRNFFQMKLKYIILLLLTIAPLIIYSQEYSFIRDLDIPVSEGDTELKNPWAGGLNYVQYNKMNLNGDELEDLVLFDRCTFKILTFINDGSEGVVSYAYAPEFEANFPELRQWMLLRDYNCDGKKDVFTGGQGGMKLYEQVEEGGSFSFESVYEFLMPATYDFLGSEPFEAPVYNISVDLPHIGDMDGDGDLDIMNFSDGSLNVFYYVNRADELDRCDTMVMELANRCYGSIAESSENNTIFLEHECDFNVENIKQSLENAKYFDELAAQKDGLHTGGTMLSLETNGDGYPELVIGDITGDSLIMTINSSSILGPDSMVAQVSNFPASFSDAEKIEYFEFPAVFNEDVNNDGIKDLMSSPFSRFSSVDDSSSWLYLNVGTDDFPDFRLEKKDWLQDEMLEHGTNAMPVIFDYNADGLGDLILGQKERIIGAGQSESKLRLYENEGTLEEPDFMLRDDDWLGLSALSLKNIYPAFGDLDGDGDQDMIIGESLGTVHYFENSAGAGNAVQLGIGELSVEDVNGEDIDPGQDVIPQLIDLDEDGLLDLILGEQWGNLNFYKNVGTSENFEFELVDEELGSVWVDNVLGIQGNCVQHFYKNENQEWELLTGNEVGTIHRWTNISGNLEGDWLRADSALASINDGQFSAPFIYNINNDSYPDLFVGNIRGGVTFYKGQFVDNIAEVAFSRQVKLYPNPSTGLFTLDWSEVTLPSELVVLNILGEEVFRTSELTSKMEVDLSGFQSGIYLLLARTESGMLEVGKVVKK